MTSNRSLQTTSSTNHALDHPRQQHRDSLWSLAAPWAMIALVAVIGAVYNNSFDNDNTDGEQDQSSSWWSLLQQQRSLIQEPDHVYNEEHPPLFPLDRSDYIGFFCAVVGLMMAAGGGIGGGGILVPIYCLVMGFSPKHAIPLSNITVFGGSVANTILNTRKRHPLADRPLVDWDLILVMEPLTIAGALIGAFLNKILPELLLTVLLVLLLSFTAYNTLKKAAKMYKKETEEFRRRMAAESELTRTFLEQQEKGSADEVEDEEEPAQGGNDNNNNNNTLDASPSDEFQDEQGEQAKLVDNNQKQPELGAEDALGPEEAAERELERKRKEELEQILHEEKSVPMANVMVLVTLFVVVLAINLLKGGGAFPSPFGIVCGSRGFWTANFLMLGWIFVISIFVRIYLVKRWEQKKRCGYIYCEGDIQWDSRATIVYPFLCCFAGFFAGMFGVGGGIVKGPLMLAMNVHPAVSSASSACMILFTSFTATTSFIVFGLLVEDYAVVCLVIGFTATLAGQLGLAYLAKKAQRSSYIAFSIGGVVLLSAFLMTIQSLLSMAEGETHHAGGICGKGD